MQYEILVDYITGNSFGSETCYGEELGLVFDNMELARKALKELEQHYRQCEKYNKAPYTNSALAKFYAEKDTKEKIREEVKKAEWCVASDKDDDSWVYSLQLQINEKGDRVKAHAFYIGYFERLEKAYVQPVGGHDLSIHF